jgi:hypothetical protein
MRYDLNKTNTENINEETPSVTLQMKPLKVDLSPEDQHTVRQALAFILYFGGPFGMAASVAIDMADAKAYYNEGDNFMALVTAAFGIIPAYKLTKLSSKFTSEILLDIRRTPNFLKKLANKVLKGEQKLTNLESKVVDFFTTNKNKIVSEIFKKTTKLSVSRYISSLKSNFSKNKLLKFLNFLYKTIGKPIGKLVITLGTITITIDQLYNILIGKENRENTSRVISSLQKRLKTLGYGKYLGNTGPNKDGVDGDFGENTQKAVLEFQNKNGIKSDLPGVVDKKTADKDRKSVV